MAEIALASPSFARTGLASDADVSRSTASAWISRKLHQGHLKEVTEGTLVAVRARGRRPTAYAVTSEGRQALSSSLKDFERAGASARVPRSSFYALAWEAVNASLNDVDGRPRAYSPDQIMTHIRRARGEEEHARREIPPETEQYFSLVELSARALTSQDPIPLAREAVNLASSFAEQGKFLEARYADATAVYSLMKSHLVEADIGPLLELRDQANACHLLRCYISEGIFWSTVGPDDQIRAEEDEAFQEPRRGGASYLAFLDRQKVVPDWRADFSEPVSDVESVFAKR